MNISNVVLREYLDEQQRKFDGKIDILSMSAMTWPSYISSSRTIMANTHLTHARNLVYPENPKVETGWEKMAGDMSTSYKKAKTEMEVFAIVPKYNVDGLSEHLYVMFLYDRENDRYEIIEKKNVEDLTEKYGFAYNNSNMDSKNVGDTFKKGETIYASNSYDEYNNYRRGINATFAFMIHNSTIEDAVLVSKSFSERAKSVETEVVRLPLNDNDFLKNLYRKSKGDYRGFPDIGEPIKDGIICAKGRIHNDQILYTMNSKNLKQINYSSDVPYYCEGVLDDIVIYSNKSLDEIPDDSFNAQIKYYLKLQTEFYEKVKDVCQEILDSGSGYSSDITFMYQKAKNILDNEIKWKDENNRKFNNFIIEFLVRREVPMGVGHKLTGRHGNKGVISEVVPDDLMPVLENGKRVDVIFNSLGVMNRLNPMQLHEQSLTFIGNRSLEYMEKNLTTYEEKNKFLVKIINYFNEEQAENLEKFLRKCDQEKFYRELKETGIIIRIPPMWDKIPLFQRIRKFYAENDWIQPYDVYIKQFGRYIKIMKKLVIGEMYILKLKQSSSKGLIARATGSISRKGIPVKTKKPHREPFSKTPIRIGDGENSNLGINIPSSIIAKMHLFYRSSIKGRQELARMLSSKIEGISKMETEELLVNRNVEILNSYFKFMGFRLQFRDQDTHFTVTSNKKTRMKTYDDGKIIIGTDKDFLREQLRREIKSQPKDLSVFNVKTRSEADHDMNIRVDELMKKRFKK